MGGDGMPVPMEVPPMVAISTDVLAENRQRFEDDFNGWASVEETIDRMARAARNARNVCAPVEPAMQLEFHNWVGYFDGVDRYAIPPALFEAALARI